MEVGVNAASSNENPYAVVPAVASRWGLVGMLLSLGIPYANVPAVASRWGPNTSMVNRPVVVSHLLTVKEVVVIMGVLPFVNDVLVVIVLVCSNRRVLEAHVHRRIF